MNKLGQQYQDEARASVRDLYNTDSNLIPDEKTGTLTIEPHSLSTLSANEILKHLCTDLSATETEYPDTNFRLIFRSVCE